MNTSTILLLLLSILIAAGVSFYQYIYTRAQGANWRSKVKSRSKVTLLLAFLRFFSVFGLLLLLINPIITRKNSEIIKTPLPIVIDNSASIADLKANKSALELLDKL